MTGCVPVPPNPFPAFNTVLLPVGTRLVRVHDPIFDGAEPNPCRGGPTRFAPLTLPDGGCLPTLYAAADFECAVHESIFHDVPYAGTDKALPIGKATSRAVSWLTTTLELRLAALHEPDLNRLGLTRADLIDTRPTAYAQTARWAEAFHRADPEIAGLVWTSRRCDPSRAYLFFGDRLPPDALAVTDRVDVAASAHHLDQIRAFGRRAGVVLTL